MVRILPNQSTSIADDLTARLKSNESRQMVRTKAQGRISYYFGVRNYKCDGTEVPDNHSRLTQNTGTCIVQHV